MNKICKNCSTEFDITDQDRNFYSKMKVPEPTHCPQCRKQRRLAFRNERHLYKDKCELCNKSIISMYSPDKPFKVYCNTCMFSDKWNALDYAQDIDFGPKAEGHPLKGKARPFFQQFRELMEKVPRINLAIVNVQNSDYCNYVGFSKDNYLCFGSIHIENCLYGSPYESKDCVDTFLARECELCYECIDCEKLYSSIYCKDCSNSSDLAFCLDLKGCKNCIGCVGLRNKEYYIFNKKHTKEEYEKAAQSLNLSSFKSLQELKIKFEEFSKKFPRKYAEILQSEDVSGNYIVKSKNCENCFDVKKCQDCKYCAQVLDGKDSYDTNYCEHFELSYEHIGYYGNNNVKFNNTCGGCSEVEYSDFCSESKNLFGCIGLLQKQYCILNKQYSKKEYEDLLPRIIDHMKKTGEYGEFPPISISPFAYNETVAQEYFPLTKEEALLKGYIWKDHDKKEYQPQTYEIQDDIKNVPEEIMNAMLACTDCGKNFKIIPQELKFYQQMSLPVPRKCPDSRHKDRMALRTPRKLYNRKCNKCEAPIQTTYSPERPETVYCEPCYLKEVY